MNSDASSNLERIVEALLFWKGEPVSAKELSEISKADEASVKSALESLKASLSGRGIILVEKDSEYSLVTCAEASALIEEARMMAGIRKLWHRPGTAFFL